MLGVLFLAERIIATRAMLPPHFTHSTGSTWKTLLMHAAHARAEARAALRAARATSAITVTE